MGLAGLLAGDEGMVSLLRERLKEHEPKMLDLDREARVKVMLWAIKKCGSVELARDALERAAKVRDAIGDEDDG